MENTELSDGAVILLLILCSLWSAGLSALFAPKNKLHLLWTIPTGFISCFVSLVLISTILGNSTGILWGVVSTIIAAPLPAIWLKNILRPNAAALYKAPIKRPPESVAAGEPTPEEIEKLKAENEQLKRQNAALGTTIEKHAKLINSQSERLRKIDLPPEPNPDGPHIGLRNDKMRRRHDQKPQTGRAKSFKKSALPKKGATVTFYYTNEKGEYGRREVLITDIDNRYLSGIDLDKNDTRTFRLDRIEDDITNIDTGEIFYL